MKRKEARRTNPFYVLLVLVGCTFVVTACAYGVMAFSDVAVSNSGEQLSPHSLNALLDRHGMVALLTQVVLLGVFSVAAMGTDQYWQRRDGSLDHSTSARNENLRKENTKGDLV